MNYTLNFFIFFFQSHPLIMLTYYAAQLGIALSVVNSYECQEVNKRVIKHQDLINGFKNIYSYLKKSPKKIY
jgi:hypothetical protein